MTDNVAEFPKKPRDPYSFIVGPFEYMDLTIENPI